MSGEHIKDTVRRKYGEAALRVLSGERASCCGDAISSNLYDPAETGELPPAVRRSMELWVGCVAGALEEKEYQRLLTEVGFVDVAVEPTRIYEFADARAVLTGAGLDAEVLARQVAGRIMGAFIRARRPA